MKDRILTFISGPLAALFLLGELPQPYGSFAAIVVLAAWLVVIGSTGRLAVLLATLFGKH